MNFRPPSPRESIMLSSMVQVAETNSSIVALLENYFLANENFKKISFY